MSINRIGCLQPDGGSHFPPEPCKGKMVANPYLLCIFCDSTSQCNFVSAHFSHPSISTASVSPSAPGTLNLIALNTCAALCSCCLRSGGRGVVLRVWIKGFLQQCKLRRGDGNGVCVAGFVQPLPE